MSTQAVSNVSLFQELQSFYQDRRTDLRQLGSALKAGDLSQAQAAFSALEALGHNGPFSNSEPFAKSNRAQAFDAVGQALQSGDLAGAQAAFASLLQTQGHHNNSSQAPAFLVSLTTTQNLVGSGNASGTQSANQSKHEFLQQRKADLDTLGQALRSGDADAAQQAYDALVALGQNGPLHNGQTFHRTDRAQDFAAIGQALAAGDLAGAKVAFVALASSFGHHGAETSVGSLPPGPPTLVPPPGSLPPGPPTLIPPQVTLPPGPPTHVPPSTVSGGPSGPREVIINVGGSNASTSSAGDIVLNLPKPSSTPEEVEINFAGSHGSTGQLTIDVSQQSTGGEEIAINFNRGKTNYQLVLNLFESAGNQAAQSNSVSLQA